MIDYGHKSGDGNPIDGPSGSNPDDRIPEFKAMKTFEYGHSSYMGSNRLGMPGGMGGGGDHNQAMTGGRGIAAGPGRFGGPGGAGNKRKNKKKNKQQKNGELMTFNQNQQMQSNTVEERSITNPEQDEEVSG